MSRTIEMGIRYNQLMAQGMRGKEATKAINEEFNSNYTDNAARGFGFQAKKKLDGTEDHIPHNRTPAPDQDEHVREVAREVFREMISLVQQDPSVMDDTGLYPSKPGLEPKEKGSKGRRGRTRDYEKFTITLDRVLFGLFEKERDKLEVSSGRLMDIILWRHYEMPKLSYETTPEVESEHD